MLKIRLDSAGRIVVVDSRKDRDGEFKQIIGFFRNGKVEDLNIVALRDWVKKGAQINPSLKGKITKKVNLVNE